MADQSVASLVERLMKAADAAIARDSDGDYCVRCGQAVVVCADVGTCETALLREAASRLSSPEGTRGFDIAWSVFDRWRVDVPSPGFSHHDGVRFEKLLREAFQSSPSSVPAATPANAKYSVSMTGEEWMKAHNGSTELASPRVSAATPAKEENWLTRQVARAEEDGAKLPPWQRLNRGMEVSAAERPAPTCATCGNAVWTCTNCGNLLPAPPGPVAQEKEE